MRADCVYYRMFYDYVYQEYLELNKSDSYGLLGGIIYSDPWAADFWGEIFISCIATNELSDNEKTDICAYTAMVGTIRSYAYRTQNFELIKFCERLISNYQVNQIEFFKWLDFKEQSITNLKIEGGCKLYNSKDWKVDYLNELNMDDHGFVTGRGEDKQ